MKLMKQAMQDDVSASVGLESGSVSVIGVKESGVGASRQLQDCAQSLVSLEIESASTDTDSPELEQLDNDVRKACAERSLTTYVKATAADLAILTQCLKDQKMELPIPAIKKVLVKWDVVV
jgi:hypothetical protein